MTFKISNKTIQIKGSNPVAEYIRTEYTNMPETSNSPDISISIQQGYVSPPKSGFSVDGDTFVDGKSVFIDRRIKIPNHGPKSLVRQYVGTLGRQIRVSHSGDRMDIVIYFNSRITSRNSIVSETLRFLNRSYIYRWQILAKVILYNDIEPLLHQQLIDSDVGFLHASGIAGDDEGVVFTGWGGAGKTSLVSELAGHDTRSMIADDLCLVNADGTVCPYHKRVQLYPYNLSEQTRNSMSDLGTLNQINWKLRRAFLGNDAVRRRLLPDSVHPIHRSDNVDISKLVYLMRENRQEITHEPLPVEELSSRAVGTIANEFQTHLNSVRALSATDPNIWISEVEYLSKTDHIYKKSFIDADRVLLRIPQSTTPTDLAEYVETNILQCIN